MSPVHEKNDFAEVSKNLARCKSKNYIGRLNWLQNINIFCSIAHHAFLRNYYI